ncbi:HEPN domain-containing protein [Acinetobacter sp. HC8-3S]
MVCSSRSQFFEKYICELIISIFCDRKSLFSEFISNQALERKYHSMFNWKESNANQFYGLFGDSFKEHMKKLLRNNTTMKDNEKEFMFLGKVRNEIVHKGISTYNLNKTASEINMTFQNQFYLLHFCLNK